MDMDTRMDMSVCQISIRMPMCMHTNIYLHACAHVGTHAWVVAVVWVVAVLAAVITKLSSSIDDIVWMLPFLASPCRAQNLARAAQYVATMIGVAALACLVAIGGAQAIDELLGEDGYWTSDRVLALASGCALLIYAIFLAHGWWQERQEAKEEQAGLDKVSAAPAEIAADVVVGPKMDAEEGWDLKGCSAGDDELAMEEALAVAKQVLPASWQSPSEWKEVPLDEVHVAEPGDAVEEASPTEAEGSVEKGQEKGQEEKTSPKRLLVVSLLGSMDDLAVFSSLLIGGTFSPPQLLLGVALGSALVTCFCLFASLFAPVVRLVQSIPLFVIIGVFSTYTFVEFAVSS